MWSLLRKFAATWKGSSNRRSGVDHSRARAGLKDRASAYTPPGGLAVVLLDMPEDYHRFMELPPSWPSVGLQVVAPGAPQTYLQARLSQAPMGAVVVVVTAMAHLSQLQALLEQNGWFGRSPDSLILCASGSGFLFDPTTGEFLRDSAGRQLVAPIGSLDALFALLASDTAGHLITLGVDKMHVSFMGNLSAAPSPAVLAILRLLGKGMVAEITTWDGEDGPLAVKFQGKKQLAEREQISDEIYSSLRSHPERCGGLGTNRYWIDFERLLSTAGIARRELATPDGRERLAFNIGRRVTPLRVVRKSRGEKVGYSDLRLSALTGLLDTEFIEVPRSELVRRSRATLTADDSLCLRPGKEGLAGRETPHRAIGGDDGGISRLPGPAAATDFRVDHLDAEAARLYQNGLFADATDVALLALQRTESVYGTNHPRTATSLNNLATLYQAQARYAEAEPLFQRALAIRERALGGEHQQTARSLNNLALLYQAQGRTAEAEPLYQRALAICERVSGGEHPHTAACLNNLAELRRAQGSKATAGILHIRALAIRERALGVEHPETAQSLNHLAGQYLELHSYSEAEPLFQRALAIRERALGAGHPDTAGTLHNLAGLYLAQGRFAKAEPLGQRALAIFERTLGAEHPDTEGSLMLLAALYQAQGRSAEALFTMQRALDIEERVIARNLIGGSDSARSAFLAQFTGSQDAFLSLLRRTFPDDRAVAAAALDRVLRRKAIGAEVLAAQRDAVLGGRYPTLVPRLKGLQGLRAQIAAKTLAGPGAEGIQQHQAWLAQWNAQRDAIEAELARQIPEMNLDLRLRGVDRAAVAKALPEGSVLVECVRFTELDFQAVFARGETPCESARYLAFVLPAGRPDDVTLLDLGEAAFIDKRIAALREAVTGETERQRAARAPNPASAPPPRSLWQRLFGVRQPARAASAPAVASDRSIEDALLAASIERIRHCGEAVRAAVFDPLRPALGDATQLFVSPDGDLYRLPFEILPAADGQYLIDACRISYLGAGRDLLRFSARQLTEPGPPLVLADPDFDLGAPPAQAAPSQPAQRGRRSRELDQAGLRFDPLPDARAEGEQVAGVLGTRPWLAERCLESELKACRSPRILHLATHGFFLADQEVSPERRSWSGFGDGDRLRGPGMENPLLRSGLALAGANTFLRGGQLPPQAEDGLLTAEDVSGMDLLDTELVVLSACETGLGEVKVGEGVFGLRRAFVLAGAQTLVMSLWKVPDEATRELMRDFYTQLLAGRPRAEALRAAQLALKARDPDPMVWGAFILQGETGVLATSR